MWQVISYYLSALGNWGLSQWADTTGLIGFFITLVGFFITIKVVRGTKAEIKRAIGTLNVVSDASAAMSKIEEIKRLQRAGQWVLMPDRYMELRKLLRQIKSSGLVFSKEQIDIFQNAITHFSAMEEFIERKLAKNETPDLGKINRTLSDQADKIHEILLKIQSEA